MPRYQEVFVPGGFPHLTYNPRRNLQLENRLAETKQNICKLVTVTGQTKSGKTVLARKILPTHEAIWIDGGTVSQEDDFWHVVVQKLDLFQTQQEQSNNESGSSISAEGSAGANFIVAKGTGKLGGSVSKKEVFGTSSSQSLSSRVVALQGLRSSKLPLVVDDFHYLPRELQGSIIRALKPLIFDGLPVAIIAIPHRRYDVLKVEREMTGRIMPIDIPAWSNDELKFIPQSGFRLLNYAIPETVSVQLANEAIGSPHLMQDFCRAICQLKAIEQSDIAPPSELTTGEFQTFYQKVANAISRPMFEKSDLSVPLEITPGELKTIYQRVANTIGRPIFEKLARGPRPRTDRFQRQLKSGREVDIYELVLSALTHIKPGLISIEYEGLRAAIREISASQTPRLQEIARVLKHMATIAASDQSSTPVVDFEEEDKKLHITDPFFAFYLRWGELSD